MTVETAKSETQLLTHLTHGAVATTHKTVRGRDRERERGRETEREKGRREGEREKIWGGRLRERGRERQRESLSSRVHAALLEQATNLNISL